MPAGFWNKKLGVLGALVRCSPSCSGHDRPLHDQLPGAVCGDFGNGRKLHFPMKDVCCLSFHEPVVALRYEMTINAARNSSLVRVS